MAIIVPMQPLDPLTSPARRQAGRDLGRLTAAALLLLAGCSSAPPKRSPARPTAPAAPPAGAQGLRLPAEQRDIAFVGDADVALIDDAACLPAEADVPGHEIGVR